MLGAFLWGAVATSSLVLGGLLACAWTPSRRSLGLLMGFGAGTLLAAVSFELVFDAVRRSGGSGAPALGFFAGALAFYGGDGLIAALQRRNQRHRQSGMPAEGEGAGLAVPMVLGIILDGIPESLVIGLGLLEDSVVSLGMLVAILLSNLPEAVAGTVGMRQSGWRSRRILLLWLLIALVCALASALGYGLFSQAPATWLSLIQAFAAGAILVMLANSMIPESYEHAGKLAGLFTVMGFFVAVVLIAAEAGRAATGR
jgi:ZIP family zinc transporter